MREVKAKIGELDPRLKVRGSEQEQSMLGGLFRRWNCEEKVRICYRRLWMILT